VKTISASELKYRVESAGHESHFFTRPTMKFFGDTMRNFTVEDAGLVECGHPDSPYIVDCYVLRRKTKTHKGAQAGYFAWFNKENYARVFPKR
jgi:hypothetical protein